MKILFTLFAVLFFLNGCNGIVNTETSIRSIASKPIPSPVNPNGSIDGEEVSGKFAKAVPDTPAIKEKWTDR